MHQLLTVIDAARLLRVSKWTVYRLVASGSIPVVRFGGTLRFRVADLEDFINGADHDQGRKVRLRGRTRDYRQRRARETLSRIGIL